MCEDEEKQVFAPYLLVRGGGTCVYGGLLLLLHTLLPMVAGCLVRLIRFRHLCQY